MTRNREAVMVNKWLPYGLLDPPLTLWEQPASANGTKSRGLEAEHF
jgi:hypothetical protein